jgi:ubiquinone/menaquinone biosynthesis C-methylase UbiE
MPSVEENKQKWDTHTWPQRGDEWSGAWGGAAQQWQRSILPRIAAYLPAATTLEIAPGHGRWTQFLLEHSQRLVLVDLSSECIESCKQRFAAAGPALEYHVNDGYSLDMVADASVDFAFSFDSLVHAELDVIRAYVTQLERKLNSHGVAFLHHSNTGAYALRMALAHRMPERLRRHVRRLTGALPDVDAWRAETVTAASVASICNAAGLSLVQQELINWYGTDCLVDCFSTITRRSSRHARAHPTLVSNSRFMREASHAAR